jgi:tRNA 2-thiouridine synthesizing protein E
MATIADISTGSVPDFPNAPQGWTREEALETARSCGLVPGESHWEVVRALQEFYARHEEGEGIRPRDLRDALDEKFHARGGIKFLYELFPGGPIHQGCELAGLSPPPGSADPGFGSVQ